jgi:transcriptional regulator with XRE-family HTH domain
VWVQPKEYELVGRALAAARERAGLTQAQPGKALRKPQSFVSNYERGQRRIDVLELLRIRTAQMKLAAVSSAPGEKAETDSKCETLRIAAIEREYAAKLDDLRHNYALRVTVDWMQSLTLFAPVHRYDVLIKRKGERIIQIDWHPTIRMIEAPPCDWGAGAERARLVCDDRLHLTDPSGQAPCRFCGKAWCRACHSTACPRCGQAI